MAIQWIRTLSPWKQWRCRSFSDKTTPPRIQSNLDPADDLIKGDGSTAGTYPSFVAADVSTGTPSHYVFDGVDDYVGNWPTMPDVYTVCAVSDDGSGPEFWTCNDTEIEDALTGGAFGGSLYRMAIFDVVLDSDQLELLKYYWLSKVPRGGCRGIERRLIVDGSCMLHHRYLDGDPLDRSDNGHDGANTNVTYSSDGAGFLAANSKITVPYSSAFQTSELCVAFTAKLANMRNVINRGTNYKITLNGTSVTLRASGVSRSISCSSGLELHHYVVTCVSGSAFRLYMDGVYIGEASAESTLGICTDDITIGEEFISGKTAIFGSMQLYNRILNDHEIKALYNRSKIG